MLVRDTCYFCTSTFQLLAILSLAIERNEVSDLYIDPQFKDADIIADRIKKTRIFENVFVIDRDRIYDTFFSPNQGIKNHIEIAITYLNINKAFKMICQENVSYNNIFVSSKALLPRLFILYYYKHRIRFNLYYFDDGIGSYYKNSAQTPKSADTTLRRLLFGRDSVNFHHETFLFSPRLFFELNNTDENVIREITPFWNDSTNANIIEDVFGVQKGSARVSEKVILLEEPYDEMFSEKGVYDINNIYKEIFSYFGNENVIIKKHPRSKKKSQLKCHYFNKYGVPFEIICMSNDVNRNVLVTYGSTAVVTPKIILGKEPVVICLYKIVPNSVINIKLLDSIFGGLKNIYSDPSKVMIPETIMELKECLASIDK